MEACNMKVCICIFGMLVASVRCGSIFAASSFKSGIDFDHGFGHYISHDGIKTVTTSYKSLGDYGSLGVHKEHGAVFSSGKPIVEVTDDQIDEVGHGSQVGFREVQGVNYISGSGGITGHSGLSDNNPVYSSGYAGPSEGHDIQTIKVIHLDGTHGGHEAHYGSLNEFGGRHELSGGLHHFGTYDAHKGFDGTGGKQNLKVIKVIHTGDGNIPFKGYNGFASGGGSVAKHAGFDGYDETFSGFGSNGGPEAIKTIKVIHTADSSQISEHSPKWV
ncbi:uncharacterized protein LOC101462524 [Ceratitis capitata]|uniref:uncharacterized protein LOC101462524 n=1 Tax=Ceratitis capitata TaxID=7213 RepID=UPI000329F5F3|nr:uncharacterized protein LOC101462524 [Ceratitis capitata]